MPAAGDSRQQCVLTAANGKRVEKSLKRVFLFFCLFLWLLFLPRQRKRVKHNSAADGDDRRKLPQYGAISRQQQKRLRRAKLRKGRCSGLDFTQAVQRNLSNRLRGK